MRLSDSSELDAVIQGVAPRSLVSGHLVPTPSPPRTPSASDTRTGRTSAPPLSHTLSARSSRPSPPTTPESDHPRHRTSNDAPADRSGTPARNPPPPQSRP